MAAELRLGVSFDLAYFRTQLDKLARIAASEFTAPIKIKLDRRVIDRELNGLQSAIKRRKYNIELNIAGNLTKQSFDALQERLDALSNRKKIEVPVTVVNRATGREIADTIAGLKARIAQNQTIRQGDGKLRIGTSIKPSITNADVADFKRAVQSKLSGISVKVKADVQSGFTAGPTGAAGLYEYMRTQGLSGGNVPGAAQVGRRTQFEAAVERATNKELQDMLRRAGVAGRSGLRTKAAMQERLRQLDDAAMESILGNLEMRMREPRRVQGAFLDKVARAVFWMAGVDPEYLRQQAAQRRALPNVSFPATVPPGPAIGPSSTGRALPAGIIPGVLPGAAFARQRFLPPQIGQELNRILRNAAFAFVDSLNSRVRQVSVREIGRQALPPAAVRGLLPGAIGREPSIYGAPGDRQSFFQRRIAEAYRRSAARGADIMGIGGGNLLGAGGSGAAGPFRPFAQPTRGGAIVPYQAPSQFGPASQLPSGYFQTGKFAAGIRGIGADLNRAKLPLSGAVRELGGEFATATKQVLLFGTAYKALAFFTSLPGQAFEAAKGLQTISNQLEAVTGSVQNADRSFAFIDDLANRFNVPLQSARDGFVKLYASMEPAGFAGSEIEGLFEGISKATATFGLSADQVDRVNNAFSQMASKGQIMSEELKGQLGDVLPGSLALFAKAAQMSIPEFSKAMEDGAFKGEAMAQVLRNVAKIMNSDFGGAAANAANTLQGALNGMQNAVQRLYEAFEPLVDVIASQAFPLIQDAVTEATAAVKAFGATVQGNDGPANMLEGNARAIYDTMLSVQEVFTAVGRVVQALVPTFSLLGRVIITVADAISRVVNTKFGGFLTEIALKVGIGMIAVQAFARVMGFQLVAALVTAAQSATTLGGSIKAMTIALRSSEVAARAFRLALTGLFVGGILFGLEKLVQHIGRVANRLTDARKQALSAAEAIRGMSATQLVSERRSRQANLAALQRAQKSGGVVSGADARLLSAMGMRVKTEGTFGRGMSDFRRSVDPNLLQGYIQREQQLLSEAEYAYRNIDAQPLPVDLEKIDLAAAEGKSKAGNKLKEYTSDLTRQLKAQLAAKLAAIDADTKIFQREKELQKARATLDIERKILLEQARLAQEDAAQYTPDTRALFLQERKAEFDQQGAKLASDYAKVIAGPLSNAVENYANTLEDEIDKLELVNKGVDELSATEKAHKLIRDSLLEVTDEDLEKVPQLRDQINALQKSFLDLGAAIDEARGKSFIGGRIGELLDQRSVLAAPLGQERLVEIQQELRRRRLPQEMAGDLFAAEEQNRKMQTMKQAATDLAGTINSSIGDALTNIVTNFQNLQQHGVTLLETLANGFKQLANTIIQEMTRAMISKAVSQLFGFVMPSAGGSTGAGQPGLTAGIQQYPLVAKANGGVLDGGFQAFASGGVVTGPTLGLVGEGRFNEAVVPLPNGKSIPVDLGQGAGNNISTNIVVNMNNGQASSQMTGNGGQALGRELEGAVRSVLLKESRPGGIIYSQR